VALLIRVLSEQAPEDIINTKLYFIDEIQLREHLSPTRSNGLNAMLRRMIEYAVQYK
jgi:cysteine desulfuration protein SufE